MQAKAMTGVNQTMKPNWRLTDYFEGGVYAFMMLPGNVQHHKSKRATAWEPVCQYRLQTGGRG